MVLVKIFKDSCMNHIKIDRRKVKNTSRPTMIAMGQLNELFHPQLTVTSFPLPPTQSHTYIQGRQLNLIPAGHGGVARRLGHLQY